MAAARGWTRLVRIRDAQGAEHFADSRLHRQELRTQTVVVRSPLHPSGGLTELSGQEVEAAELLPPVPAPPAVWRVDRGGPQQAARVTGVRLGQFLGPFGALRAGAAAATAEAFLAAVVGPGPRECRGVNAGEAMGWVLGYTCALLVDGSHLALGPCLLARDAVRDPRRLLAVSARVNGRRAGDPAAAATAEWALPGALAEASAAGAVLPGSVVLLPPAGARAAFSLAPGDEPGVTVEGVGELRLSVYR